jgi:hypothetical protein
MILDTILLSYLMLFLLLYFGVVQHLVQFEAAALNDLRRFFWGLHVLDPDVHPRFL